MSGVDHEPTFLTSNDDLIAELEAAANKWLLEKNKYTLEALRDARKAVLQQMRGADETTAGALTGPERHAMRVASECKDLDPTARQLLAQLYERCRYWPRLPEKASL